MNLDGIGSQDLSWAFKTANLTVATLAVFHNYLLACFGGVIGLLEFTVPPQAQTYGSFLFSFLGRGVFYTLIGSCVTGSGFFRLTTSFIIIIIGLGFIALEAVPSISPPENMNSEGGSIGIHDDDII